MAKTNKYAILLALGFVAHGGAASAHNNVTGNMYVDGGICMGFDCVNGSAFDFDTLKLHENNLRVYFQDTSAIGGFASNDWRIVINDSFSGGANYFGIEDASAGRSIARFFAGARANAFVIDSGGDLGLGTSAPVLDIHAVTGNTPSLRLDQDGSSGFTAQAWDLAGNEANFFIRDVTNGSSLPFRIQPGAPSNSIFVNSSGLLGFGTSSPNFDVHIKKNKPEPNIVVENQGSAGGAAFSMRVDGGTTADWKFKATGDGVFKIRDQLAGYDAVAIKTNAANDPYLGLGVINPLHPIHHVSGARLTTGGAWTNSSDVALKSNFESVEKEAILERLAMVPITAWSYKSEGPEVRHLGPTAQDFYSAFELGDSDRAIGTVDADGVALAAIQALYEKIRSLEAEIASLKGKEAELVSKVQDLEGANRELLSLQAKNLEILERLDALEQGGAMARAGSIKLSEASEGK